tara:strand:+ start:126 stop:431 length:306 start_codon:yes stop_codon:yes gene_type:complete
MGYKFYNHVWRGIPNNFLTRWVVGVANDLMKKSESRWKFNIKYRLGGSKKKRTCKYEVKKDEGKIFSLYLVKRSGYENFRKRESEYIMEEYKRMNSKYEVA